MQITKKAIKIFVPVVVLFCLPKLLTAQIVFNSVEDVWKYADAHNTNIHVARYQADIANASKKQAYGILLPQASLTGSGTYNTIIQTNVLQARGLPGVKSDSFITLQFGQKYVYAGGLNVQLDIINLQNWYNVSIARKTEEMNKASLANTRKTIYQQIASQYYSYLLMKEAAKLANDNALVADSIYEAVNNKYKEGSVDEASVDVAKINFEREQQTSITAAYQMITAMNNLKALIGASLKDSVEINSSLQAENAVQDDKQFGEDPSIKLAFYQEKIALNQYKQANSAFAPVLSIVYNTSTTQYDSTFRPFSTSVIPWFPATYWSVRATLPIFTGGTRLLQSQKNKIAYWQSKEQYENTLRQSVINDENIRLNYRKSVEVLVKAEDVMNLSFDNYKHLTYKYGAGVASLADRLKAFSDYIDYQNAYLNSLSDMLVQLYQIKIRQQSF
jgi:outer membrane protein TolC